jgi:hypothetical protein
VMNAYWAFMSAAGKPSMVSITPTSKGAVTGPPAGWPGRGRCPA